jgi:hypothetical protein
MWWECSSGLARPDEPDQTRARLTSRDPMVFNCVYGSCSCRIVVRTCVCLSEGLFLRVRREDGEVVWNIETAAIITTRRHKNLSPQ